MRHALVRAAVLAGVLAFPCAASALPAGSFDPSFGNGSGIVTPDVIAAQNDDPVGVAVDSQGRSVGVYGGVTCGCSGSGDVHLARFKADGSLDSSFDGDGVALAAHDAGVSYSAAGVAIQSTGKIVVAYWDTSGEWFVRRYNDDGTQDMTFAGSGEFLRDSDVSALSGIALDGDKIVLVGADNASPTKLAVLKLTADGAVDGSFNSGNLETVDYGGTGDGGVAAAATPDHKLVLLGLTSTGGAQDATVTRLGTDGTPDPDFGTLGLKTVHFDGNWAPAHGVVAGSDGSVAFAGNLTDPMNTSHVALTLTKLTATGALDASFGTSGQQTSDLSGSGGSAGQVFTLVGQPDGALLVGGVEGQPASSLPPGFIYRYTPAGVLDPAFSGDGKLSLKGDGFSAPFVSSLALAPDRRVVAFGPDITFTPPATAATVTVVARVLTAPDNCPLVTNADQADLDGDGLGDACDDDVDGDGLSNGVEAAIGSDPRKTDSDGDGKLDGADACPTLAGTLANGCPAPQPAPQTPSDTKADTGGTGGTAGTGGTGGTGGGNTAPPVVIDKTAPKLGFTLASIVKRATFLKKGLSFRLASDEPVSINAQLVGTLKGVHVARAGDVILAEKNLPLGGGNRTIAFKLGAKQKKLIGKTAKLTVRITAFDAAGNRTVVSRVVRVK
jgi:uncharacterized delta-60 repeat protein